MRKTRYIIATLAILGASPASASAWTESEQVTHIAYLHQNVPTYFNIGSFGPGAYPQVELWLDHKPLGVREVGPGESIVSIKAVLVRLLVGEETVHVEAWSHHGTHRLGVVERWSD